MQTSEKEITLSEKYHVNGEYKGIRTKVRHGSKSTELSEELISRIAKQCNLSKKDFVGLVECSISESQYMELVAGKIGQKELMTGH